MLILNMILRITGFTQEQLANYIGVSRASINSWLIDDKSMGVNSKKRICEKFQIPLNYFQIDLEQNLDYYKLIYSTINENWKRINVDNYTNKTVTDKINNILNQIESDVTPILYEKLTENEILRGLSNGYNPFTGEVFENNHILNNQCVKEILQKLYKNYTNGSFSLTIEDLSEEQSKLFEELKKWRKDKYISEGYFNAYLVFNNNELINIITADIKVKEDLLKVKGIGTKKYKKYAEDLFNIIKAGKYIKNEKSSEEDIDPFMEFSDVVYIEEDFLS